MNKLVDYTRTGQLVFFAYRDYVRGVAPAFTSDIFKTIASEIPSASMHIKPATDGCIQAASVRVTNDMKIGVRLRHELKSRMFMAKTVEGEPIIIMANYRANFLFNAQKLKSLLPRDKNSNSLIKLPFSAGLKKDQEFDQLDLMDDVDSPYAAAKNALSLGMGQINPFSVMMRAEQMRVKLISLYDNDLFSSSLRYVYDKDTHLTTNVGHRNWGIYVEKGHDYLDLAIASAKPLVINDTEYKGAIVGDFAEIILEHKKPYREPTELAHIYRAAQVFDDAVRSTWER